MKRSVRVLFAVIAVLALVTAAALLFAKLRPPAQPWLSWRLDEDHVRALESVLSASRELDEPVIRRLDANTPLESHARALSRGTVLFTLDGLEPSSLAEKSALFPAKDDYAAIADSMPGSQRSGGIYRGARYGLPILSDHGELACQRASLISLGIEAPKTFEAFETALETARTRGIWPLVAAGGDDSALALFISMLVEARYGQEAFTALAETLSLVSGSANGGAADESGDTPADYRALIDAEPLKGTVTLLADWRTRALLHPEWFRLEERDIHALMEAKVAVFVAMSLSAHRRVPQRSIERYDSTWFPGAAVFSRQRAFVAPTIIAVPLNGSRRRAREALTAVEHLASRDVQSGLSAKSGLAPVHSNAEVRDKQAGDARLWIAASNRPLAPLEAAFPTESAFGEFARQLREAIAASR